MVELHYRNFELDGDTVEDGKLQLRQKLPHEFLLRVILRFAKDRKERYVNDELTRANSMFTSQIERRGSARRLGLTRMRRRRWEGGTRTRQD